jgi:hypothetical protein
MSKLKMHTKSFIRTAALSLLATTLGCSLISSAKADEIIQQTTTTTVDPMSIAPGTTTTVQSTGNYNIPVSTTTSRTTVLDPGPVDQVTEKRTVYTRLSPADASQTFTTTSSRDNLNSGRPNYGQRLQNLRAQLDKAISNNWLNAAQVADLNSQYDSLAAQEVSVRSHDYLKVDCDDFEKKLTAFNIQLSSGMSGANHM